MTESALNNMSLLSKILPNANLPNITQPVTLSGNSAATSSPNRISTATVQVVKSGTKSSGPKKNCPKCDKELLETTLASNGGICGRCKNKANGIGRGVKVSKDKAKEKAPCSQCNKEFTQRTLDKYKGMCGKCAAGDKEPQKVSCIECKTETT